MSLLGKQEWNEVEGSGFWNTDDSATGGYMVELAQTSHELMCIILSSAAA